jgi:hypothetical protein
VANIKERLNLIRLKEPNVSIGIFESPVKFFCSDVKCLYDFHQQDSVTLQMSSAALMSADLADLMLATTVLPKTMIANMKTKSFIRKKASWLG